MSRMMLSARSPLLWAAGDSAFNVRHTVLETSDGRHPEDRNRHHPRRYRTCLSMNLIILMVSCSLYAVNRFVLAPATGHWFLLGYFNDMLAPSVLLPVTNLWSSAVTGCEQPFKRLWQILLLTITAGLFWELIAPAFVMSTSDFYDLVAYVIGGIIYWAIARGCLTKRCSCSAVDKCRRLADATEQ